VGVQAHPQKFLFAENLRENGTQQHCLTSKNGVQGLQKIA